MKNLKKVASFLLAAAMTVSVSACGKTTTGDSSVTSSGAQASSAAENPAELTILVAGDNTPPDTNSVLAEIKEKTKVTLKVSYVSAGEVTDKLNAFIAAKTLPDIFRTASMSTAENLKKNGMLADLTQYVKNSANIQAELGSVLNDHPLNKDGKIYGLFCADTAYAQNMSIRTDWLKNLGMSMPTDLNSLYNVLYAFTYKDPDQNGQNDTMGLGASIVASWNNFTSILGAYGVTASTSGLRPYQMQDGTVTTGMKNKNFLEAVKYFHKLYEAGVMDPDFATIPAMDSYGKVWNGKVGAFDFQCAGTTNNWMPARYTETPVPTFDFASIKGPSGVAAQGKMYPTYNPTIVVSSTCKDVAAAVRFLDFLISSDGSTLVNLGVEGKHFNWIDKASGKYKMIEPYNDSKTNRNDGVFVYANFLKPKMTTERLAFNEQTKQGVAMAEAMCTIEWPFIYTTFNAETVYGKTLGGIEKEVFCQLISSKGDLDKEYKEGIARWEAEGGLDWEKEATAAYKSQK